MIFCIILDRKWLIACILDEQCIKLQVPEKSSEEIPSESTSESTAKPCNKGKRLRRRDTACNECCNDDDDGESKSGSGYVMCLSIISMLHDAYTNYL